MTKRAAHDGLLVMAPAVLVIVACGTTGARPHDMGAAGHEAAAEQERAAARAHQGAREPQPRPAGGPHGITCPGYDRPDACYRYWTSWSRPSRRHLADAALARRRADAHRSAARALREAERRACAGVPDAERDLDPFYHREDIARVDGIDSGARIVFRPLPGLTAQWLRQVLDCHRARIGVIGYDEPPVGYSPLAVRGVGVAVRPAGRGVAVELTSGDERDARVIKERAAALLQRPPGGSEE